MLGSIVILWLGFLFYTGVKKGAAKLIAPFLGWILSFIFLKPAEGFLKVLLWDSVYAAIEKYAKDFFPSNFLIDTQGIMYHDLTTQLTELFLVITAILIINLLVHLVIGLFGDLEKKPLAKEVGMGIGGIIRLADGLIKIWCVLYVIQLAIQLKIPAALSLQKTMANDIILNTLNVYNPIALYLGRLIKMK